MKKQEDFVEKRGPKWFSLPFTAPGKIINEDLTGMATVKRNLDENFMIAVHPERGCNDAYFKICNHQNYEAATKIIRLSFKETRYFDHKTPGKSLWEIKTWQLKEVEKLLRSPLTKKDKKERGDFQSYWEFAIYLWNYECGFTDHPDYDKSFPEGCKPDSKLLQEPQFVCFNQEIPPYHETIRF
jgi:hypothetical protein